MGLISRRRFLASGLSAAGVLQGCATNGPAKSAHVRRPNIIFILTDDQGYGDLGCHGNPVLRTPNLDRLHDEGVRFTQFHVCPVCSPTRASLMTGRYNYRTGVVDTYQGRSMMDPDEVTLPELLEAHGYRTGIFGKWHLGDHYPMRAMDRGFQESLVHGGGGLCQPSDPPPGSHYFDPMLSRNGIWERCPGYCTDVFTNAAIDFVERNRQEPFFAYLALNAPHVPLEVADSYVAPYLASGVQEHTAKVYGMIANIDENIGRLLASLERNALTENTLVIFMTDNGSQMPENAPRFTAGMRDQKGSVYEGGIRVPCFMRYPHGWRGGRDVDTLAAHIDILPTLLDLCGIRTPRLLRLDGRSLLPLLSGPAVPWPDRTLYTQWHRGNRPELYRNCAAYTRRYKLVNGKELYDRTTDLGETNDVAAAHPDVVERMRAGYEAWFADVCGTRDFATPPRVFLGSPHENPVLLTRQDWRCETNWTDPKSIGYWEAKTLRAGRYDISYEFEPRTVPEKALFRFGTVERSMDVSAGRSSCSFKDVEIEQTEGRLEAMVALNGQPAGVRYVTVTHLGGHG